MTGRLRLGCALIGALALAACSPSDTTTSTSAAFTTTTTVASATTTASVGSTTTPSPTTSTTVGPTTTTAMRGEPVDGGPPNGAILSVVGVAFDDVLNLRAAPGAGKTILYGIPPTYDAVQALGKTRTLPAWWSNVEYKGVSGWVNISYLAYAGATSDMTSAVLADTGGSLQAPSMTELGAAVAAVIASEDPPSDIVLVVSETIGDLGEVTYDVIGLGDDSVLGLRLHVFGEPNDSGFSLESVESTVLCQPTRGVTDDGLCV